MVRMTRSTSGSQRPVFCVTTGVLLIIPRGFSAPLPRGVTRNVLCVAPCMAIHSSNVLESSFPSGLSILKRPSRWRTWSPNRLHKTQAKNLPLDHQRLGSVANTFSVFLLCISGRSRRRRHEMSQCDEKFTIFLVLIVVLAPFGAQTDC